MEAAVRPFPFRVEFLPLTQSFVIEGVGLAVAELVVKVLAKSRVELGGGLDDLDFLHSLISTLIWETLVEIVVRVRYELILELLLLNVRLMVEWVHCVVSLRNIGDAWFYCMLG
jgi:hypothetical protein